MATRAPPSLLVAAPVDEMVHAVLAQHTLISRMQRSLALDLVHMTDQEQFDYEPGCYTDACYQAAAPFLPPVMAGELAGLLATADQACQTRT
ncbi:hypothetical protein FDG2_1700 [Candidatus Protofrankia californiensis]|uniref:Uncharacterized protein n=1 Tax=Candidatus Protofrankia californiensis TaxID=1839754 RepID=A0A1C3NW49_9ACTN|nr:hypothetical protein FDG2_1700 [Candidatus Protofrankia californiensis]